MISLPRHVRNLAGKSTISPSRPLQGFPVHVISSVEGPGKYCNTINHPTVQLVTGLDLVRFYHSSDANLQHPNYANEGTRLQPLVNAGFHMVARDRVECYSCQTVIQGWKKEDRSIDIHCLHNSNCGFDNNYVEKLSEIDDLHMASRNIVGRLNHYGERPVIKERIKDNSYSSTKPITIRDSKSPQVPCYQATEVIHPACQWSVSTYGHLAKGSNANTSDDTMSTPPSEKMIMVSLLVSLLVSMNSYNFYTVVPVATHLCVISL